MRPVLIRLGLVRRELIQHVFRIRIESFAHHRHLPILHAIGAHQFAGLLMTDDQMMALIVIRVGIPLGFVTLIQPFSQFEIEDLESQALHFLQFLPGAREIRHIVAGRQIRVFGKIVGKDRVLVWHEPQTKQASEHIKVFLFA
jgi:hypothetical protein